jgi:ABC-2 type transport system permease protein
MHNIWLIAKREYLERIRAKSFMIMTILIPALMGGLLFGVNLANGKGASDLHLAVVSQDSQFGLDLQSELEARKTPKFTVDVISPPGADTRSVLSAELKDKSIDGYLWATPASPGHPQGNFEWKHKPGNYSRTKDILSVAIRDVLTREGLAHSGMGASQVSALTQPVDLGSGDSAENDSVDTAESTAFGFFFIMYFVILFYGMNVARSIIEEKTSRIFEVLLATIRPEELMAGKVIGVGSVGLTQVGIWMVVALGLSFYGTLGSEIKISVTLAQGIYFVVFFLLGYTLYSGMAAALGAMTSSEQELQQMNIFLMLPLIACSGVIAKVMSDPDGPISKGFSYFPFCAPLIMYVRIAIHQPPWYEIAGSIAGMVLTLLAVLWLAARIYRVGILMYGKKPNLPEIVRWLRYS